MHVILRKYPSPTYDPNETCKHGHKFEERKNILNIESKDVQIHHIKNVVTENLCVLFRPTIEIDGKPACMCKQIYTGKENCLLRVSSAKSKISERRKVLHFVSYEFYFEYLIQLLTGGQTMSAFIKSKNIMNEVFFGFDKSPDHKKILSKGFEIFIHDLVFPEDSNHCKEFPQKLKMEKKKMILRTVLNISLLTAYKWDAEQMIRRLV